MRSDQMRLKRGDAFPLFDNHNDVVPRRPLHWQAAGDVGRREVFDAAGLRPDLGHNLANLVQEARSLAGVQLDGGKDNNHAVAKLYSDQLCSAPKLQCPQGESTPFYRRERGSIPLGVIATSG